VRGDLLVADFDFPVVPRLHRFGDKRPPQHCIEQTPGLGQRCRAIPRTAHLLDKGQDLE
jgi:hypothetical protein